MITKKKELLKKKREKREEREKEKERKKRERGNISSDYQGPCLRVGSFLFVFAFFILTCPPTMS